MGRQPREMGPELVWQQQGQHFGSEIGLQIACVDFCIILAGLLLAGRTGDHSHGQTDGLCHVFVRGVW